MKQCIVRKDGLYMWIWEPVPDGTPEAIGKWTLWLIRPTVDGPIRLRKGFRHTAPQWTPDGLPVKEATTA